MTLIVQSLEEGDIPELTALEAKATARGWSKRNIGDSLKYGHECFKLLIDHEICGYIILRVAAKELEILNFVIARNYQEKGLGQQFLKSILSHGQFSDITDVWLEVRKCNHSAQAVYKKFGFCVSSIRKNYYNGGGLSDDAVVMHLAIANLKFPHN